METQPQLTQEERYQIYALMKADHTQTEIARVLGRSKSTISRELRRNRGKRGYRPKQAHQKAQQRRQEAVYSRITDAQWARIDELLREDWSPQQVSEWLASEDGVCQQRCRVH